ncbi:MAG: CPBP family intramembrane glutamic endopeptidase [Pseudomonadota bacterium]
MEGRPTPFERFCAPARPTNQVWRVILGIVLIFVIYAALIGLAAGAVLLALGQERFLAGASQILDTPSGVLILLGTFAGLAIGASLTTRWLHRRPASTLFGPGPRVVRDFVRCGMAVSGIYIVGLIVVFVTDTPVPNVSSATWLLVLPLTLIGLLVQTGAEEMVFRGYLQQQLGARFRSPFFWMVLPSVLFGLIHFDPGSAQASAASAAAYILVATTVFGLIAADLTARTGSIGAAWGFHFTNNFFALSIVAMDGTITGLSLYLTPYTLGEAPLSPTTLITDAAVVILAWLICRRVTRR